MAEDIRQGGQRVLRVSGTGVDGKRSTLSGGITWSSSNPAVASVTPNGIGRTCRIDGVAVGQARVTCNVVDSGFTFVSNVDINVTRANNNDLTGIKIE